MILVLKLVISKLLYNLCMIRRVLWFFEAVCKVQKFKYERRGLTNNLIGYLLLFFMFYFIPNLCKPYWPTHFDDVFLFQFKWQCGILFFSTLIYFLMYLPGYLGAGLYKKYEIADVVRVWDKPDWPQVKWKIIGCYILNNLLIFPVYLYIGVNVLGVKMKTQGFPSNWQVFRTVISLLFVDDFIYMISHRLFHEVPSLYKYHKVHHSVQANFSLIGNHNHPIDHYFGAVIPATFGLGLFQPHLYTSLVWFAFKLLNISQGHSGYQFPWSPVRILPFIYGNSYHEFHHRINQGNYSTSLYLFELALGTNDVFLKEQFKKYGQEWVSPPPFWSEQVTPTPIPPPISPSKS